MPAQRQHWLQAEHNEQFLSSLDLDQTPFLDWAITVCFYAALHYVDAYLALLGLHPSTHSEREKEVRHRLRPLYFHYRSLKRHSLDARYGAFQVDPTTVFTSNLVKGLQSRQLAAIRSYITGLLSSV